jgi:hypothetical protein
MENHPIVLDIPAPDTSSRGLALATLLFMVPKLIIAIPHLFVLYFLALAAFVVAFAGQIVVLFTGKYPKEMHEFVVGFFRWQVRVNAYLLGLRDEYPPFSIKN